MDLQSLFFVLASMFMVMGIVFLFVVIVTIIMVARKAQEVGKTAGERINMVNEVLSESNLSKVSWSALLIPLAGVIVKTILKHHKTKS